MDDLFGIAIRVILFYAYTLAAVRLSGKRSIGELSILDFIVALTIGDLFDDIFWGTQPFASGLVALTVVIMLHMIFSLLGFHSSSIGKFILGEAPVEVIKNGQLLKQGMRHERSSRESLESQLRLHKQEKISDIEVCAWEPSGELSMILKPEARPAQKSDKDRIKKLVG